VVEDVIAGSVKVTLSEGGTTTLPDNTRLTYTENVTLTAYEAAPEHTTVEGETLYLLVEAGEMIVVEAHSRIVGAAAAFRVAINMCVRRDGNLFWEMSWRDDVPRGLL
jgi:hypothetical protein